MRRWGYPVAVLGLVLLLILVWRSWSVSDLSRFSQFATVVAVPLTIIALGVAMRMLPSGGDGAVDAARLAENVRAGREQFLRQSLGAVWTQKPAEVQFTAPAPGELSPAIESLLVHWQQLDDPGLVQGTMGNIADFYREVQADPAAAGRLMITGAPGSGKSVLASKLVVDLLTSLPEGTGPGAVKVPVWLSLTGCGINPKTPKANLPDVFRAWLSKEIHDVYGLPSRLARSLVEEHRVLPVLDGLDELDPARAVAVVTALNHGVREPVILTCRSGDYASLAAGEPAEPHRPVLVDAKHVIVRPLEPQAIDDFLTAALTPNQRARWATVLAAARQKQPIAAVLASPLLLSFAVRAYRDADDPGRLLLLTPDTAMAALVEPAITATVNNDNKATDSGWSSPQVLNWLECLAVNQRDHAKGSEYDILLPDLWTLGGRFFPRWLIPSAFVLAGIVCGALAVSWRSTVVGLGAVLTLYIAALTARRQSKVERVVDLRTPARRASLTRALAAGLAFGLAAGLVPGLRTGLLTSWLVGGMAAGLAAGLMIGLKGEPSGTRNCSQLTTQCLAYTLAVGLGAGLLVGLGIWLVATLAGGHPTGLSGGLEGGLVFGLGTGLLFGLIFGNGSTWLRYLIGTTQAARRGAAPHRLASFLDWGLDVGLFRMSGYTLQFRHRDIYQALLTYAATPVIYEGASETNVHETP